MTGQPEKAVIKLDIGCGDKPVDGYVPIDRKFGKEAYPLDVQDGTVDEIRASHVLEHFPHGQVGHVLADWVRCLRPGGILRVAVPDFETIARAYLNRQEIPVQGYVMGGQTDPDDFHRSIFDREELTTLFRQLGLRQIRTWKSDQQDCAALPISLNLECRKPLYSHQDIMDMGIGAVMSIPRLGFQDNFFCAFAGLVPFGINLRKTTGAFWGQCLERGIDECLAEGREYILTLDYDTVFTKDDVEELCYLMLENPSADAIAPLQANRCKSTPLMTIPDGNGGARGEIAFDELDSDLIRASTAHFGLTMIRASAIRDLNRPLFWSTPTEAGTWDEGRVDDDIMFWHRFSTAKKRLCIAPRIAVGHAELMIRWPGRDLQAIYQHPNEFWESGKPEDTWQ